MPKSFFDIVCLGGELPGLIAAALLAKQGYRTLLVAPRPAGGGEGGRSSSTAAAAGGAPAPAPAAPLLFVGDHSSPALRAVLAQLNLTQELRNRLRPLVPSYQVVLPGHRLDLGGRNPDTDQEVRRELPELYDQLDPLLTRAESSQERLAGLFDPPPLLPPGSWSERRAWRARLQLAGMKDEQACDTPFPAMEPGHPLRLLFEAPLHFLTGAAPDSLSELARARLLGHLGRGISSFPGDLAGLGEALRERFRSYGGVIHKEALPEEVQLPWWGSGPALLRFDHGREEIGCRLVLLAQPIDRLLYLLAPGRRRRKLERQQGLLRIGAWRATLRLRVSSVLIPEAMAPVLFLIDDPRAPLVGPNLILVTLSGEGEVRTLTASVHLPASELADEGDRLLARTQRQLEERLRLLLPYLDHHLLEAGRLDRAELQPLPVVTGVGALPYRSPYPQLVLASGAILPELGLEGDFLAGLGASLVVNGKVRRRELLPR